MIAAPVRRLQQSGNAVNGENSASTISRNQWHRGLRLRRVSWSFRLLLAFFCVPACKCPSLLPNNASPSSFSPGARRRAGAPARPEAGRSGAVVLIETSPGRAPRSGPPLPPARPYGTPCMPALAAHLRYLPEPDYDPRRSRPVSMLQLAQRAGRQPAVQATTVKELIELERPAQGGLYARPATARARTLPVSGSMLKVPISCTCPTCQDRRWWRGGG